MKKLSMMLVTLTLSAMVQASEPKVIVSPVDHVFVPQGFDNNDNVEVVVTGKFPNPCYIKNKVAVNVDGDKIFIKVTALKKDNSSSALCEDMSVPFKEDVTIGNLQGGNYEIIVNESTRFEKREKLNVTVSNSNSVDDHLYPIVDYVELGFTGGVTGDVMLVARTPSDCVKFDRVELVSNKKDVVSVLPIMKKVSQTCNEKRTRVTIPVRFNPRTLSNREIMLFVRSIEGKAVNTIINR